MLRVKLGSHYQRPRHKWVNDHLDGDVVDFRVLRPDVFLLSQCLSNQTKGKTVHWLELFF